MQQTRVAEAVAEYVSETAVRMMMRTPHMMVPYYSVCVLDSDRVPTAAINGTTMWINRKFYDCLNREQRLTMMCHELWHKMLLHNTRCGLRDPDVFNEAGDHVINITLTKNNFAPLVNIHLPDGSTFNWVCDMKYDGWTTEQVYDDLMKNGGRKGGCGQMRDVLVIGTDPDGNPCDAEGKPNGHHDGKTMHEVVVEFEAKVRKEMQRAATMARMAGRGMFGFDMALDEIDHVKVPWYDVLQEYYQSMCTSDFSYARYDRRAFVTSGFIAPDLYTPQMGGIVMFTDCSGSVSNEALRTVNMHQKDLLRAARPAWIEVGYFCDKIIGDPVRYEKGEYEDMNIRRKGSGGTCFAPAMDYVRDMEEKPALLIMLTDLEGDGTEEDPGVPVIWLCVSDIQTAKFGTVLNVE